MKHQQRLKRLALGTTAVVGVTIGGVSLAQAAYTFWTGAAGTTDWTDPGNWSNGEPGIGGSLDTTAVVGSPFVQQPIINVPAITDYLVRIGDSAAGGPAPLAGVLTIDNGGTLTLSRYMAVGYSDNSDAQFIITGAGTAFTITEANGLGDLYVAEGNNSIGRVEVSAGASVLVDDLLDVGVGAGSSAVMTVDRSTVGIGASFIVGDSGSGTLTVLNGSVVSSGTSQPPPSVGPVSGFLTTTDSIGAGTGSVGLLTVSGAGSVLTSYNPLVVGGQTPAIIPFYLDNFAFDATSFFQGHGTLLVTDGGTVESGVGVHTDPNFANVSYIGGTPLSVGVATVTDPNSNWTVGGSLVVGGLGQGTLNITNSGLVSVASGVTIAEDAASAGTLNIGAAAGAAPAAPGTLNTSTVTFGAGNGDIVFNHTDTSGNYVFDATITGGSATTSAVDVYAGTTVMTGVGSDYFGPTTIHGGILAAGAANAFSPNSDYAVQTAGTLDLRGNDQTVLSLANAGLVNMGTGTPATTVLTATNYVGQGGTINFNTFLGDDTSPSDRLVINSGTASGNSFLHFTNAGGPGALTTANGILVVDAINNGTTAAGAFTMSNPELRPGAFDYRLFQGGPDGSDPENWYLRSTFTEGPTPPPTPGPGTFPIIGPELATYGVVQPMAQQLGRAMLGVHDERLADLYQTPCEPAETNASSYTKAPVYTKAPTDCSLYGWRPAVWGRVFGQQIEDHYQAFADPRANGQITGLQAGFDVLRSDGLIPGHTDYAGLYAAYGNANVDVSGLVTNAAATAFVLQHTGHLNLNAYSGGAYWTHYGPQGWYLDLTLQGTSFGGAASTEFAHLNTSGSGFISSLEGGYPIALPVFGPNFVLEPQAQVLWEWVSFASGNDGLGPVALGATSETTARVGLKGKWTITTDSGQIWQPYVRANFWSDFGGDATTMFGMDSVPLISHAQYMDVDAGFTTKINAHLSAFADAGYQFAVSHDGGGKHDGVKGTAGLRYQW